MTRTREINALGPSTTVWNWWNTKDTMPPWTSASMGNTRGYFKETVDVVTPNFSKLQAEGRVINNPMWVTEVDHQQYSDSGWKFQSQSGGTMYYGECQRDWCQVALGAPSNPGLDQSILDYLLASTATTAWAGVDVGEFQGLAALGELHSTLNMLGDPVRSLSTFLWQRAWANADWKAARGRAAKARALANLLSSLWLQYQYAFRPIIKDIEAILHELQTQTFSPRRTSRAKAEQSVSTQSSYVAHTGGGAIDIDIHEEVERKYSVRSGILYEGSVDPAKQFGFHWTALPSAAWELTPWSFVADWFINVGDYLQAISPKIGVHVLAGWQTIEVKTKVTRYSGAARLNVAGWTTVRSPNGVSVSEYRNFQRRNVIMQPQLVVEPVIPALLRGNRGINAYMLFLQQFIKPSRL